MKFFSLLFFSFTKCLAETTKNMTYVYSSETLQQPVRTDCYSKGMRTCGSTGPFVCWEHNVTCPGFKPHLRGSITSDNSEEEKRGCAAPVAAAASIAAAREACSPTLTPSPEAFSSFAEDPAVAPLSLPAEADNSTSFDEM